jgi:hypothetical protein
MPGKRTATAVRGKRRSGDLMPQAPDSLEEIWPTRETRRQRTSMTEAQPETLEGGAVSPPQIDRVAEVLGPLEQVVLAADQELGSIQQQVSVQEGEEAAHVERRVREAAVAQRKRLGDLRGEMTDRRSEITARFDAILALLDEVDRDLATRAGADVRVTLTERQRVEIAHDVPPATGYAPAPPAPPAALGAPPNVPVAPAPESAKPRKERGFARWFRRSKRSSS